MVPNRAAGIKQLHLSLSNVILILTIKYTGIHRCLFDRSERDRRIGNGVRVSDRTAAVRRSQGHDH